MSSLADAPAPTVARVRTLSALLAAATARLAAAGVPSPRHDAEALAAHVLGIRRGQLALADPDALLDEAGRYERLVERRAARVPLQHLTGRAPFRRLDLAVGPGVFVARPETELLVDAALAALAGVERPLVVDLCTGSGALAAAIADEHPSAAVVAVDADSTALAWARRNLGADVQLVQADIADIAAAGALPELTGRVDCVVSNPPYLSERQRDELAPEVADHDPPQALFAGPDGLDVLRHVERAARRLLRPGGFAVVEHGDDQQHTAPALFADGWHDVTDHRDLAGRPRYLTAVRS